MMGSHFEAKRDKHISHFQISIKNNPLGFSENSNIILRQSTVTEGIKNPKQMKSYTKQELSFCPGLQWSIN